MVFFHSSRGLAPGVPAAGVPAAGVPAAGVPAAGAFSGSVVTAPCPFLMRQIAVPSGHSVLRPTSGTDMKRFRDVTEVFPAESGSIIRQPERGGRAGRHPEGAGRPRRGGAAGLALCLSIFDGYDLDRATR